MSAFLQLIDLVVVGVIPKLRARLSMATAAFGWASLICSMRSIELVSRVSEVWREV